MLRRRHPCSLCHQPVGRIGGVWVCTSQRVSPPGEWCDGDCDGMNRLADHDRIPT
ncbi:hypothetical protein [Rhabdothermincola sp.]|jgi:hypothetical protein|uniref:hypothetical protein n=1 Tax=Rhabdothermincola sp. TaxID=2820405 RepID=UPI002FDFE808